MNIFSFFASTFKYEPTFTVILSWNNLPRIKDGAYVINLDDKNSKKHIGFHYLLTEMQLYILILLELHIFLSKY